MYAVRHGQTGRIWMMGLMWLWPSVESLKNAWQIAKECELVQGELRDHKIITIELVER